MNSPPAQNNVCLERLLARHSIGPKYLGPPGPNDEQLRRAVAASLRAPDHGKLTPFRFVVIRDTGLKKLATLFVDYGARHGKSGEDLAMERTRALQAPVVIAVVARIHPAHEVPVHEQWIAVGGAIANMLNALHLLGYGAKMLSGLRAADPKITGAFCKDDERLVGWIRPAPRQQRRNLEGPSGSRTSSAISKFVDNARSAQDRPASLVHSRIEPSHTLTSRCTSVRARRTRRRCSGGPESQGILARREPTGAAEGQ